MGSTMAIWKTGNIWFVEAEAFEKTSPFIRCWMGGSKSFIGSDPRISYLGAPRVPNNVYFKFS